MPQYTQYFTTSAGSHLNNRCIFTGPQTSTPWPVPEGTTEVHVHVWGGGGGSCHTPLGNGRGGGGGGYARASLVVTDSDSLSITVGGAAGTSSVTVPTQSPGSPISATGGGNGTSTDAGTGGTGTVTLAPTQCQWYCYTATGGAGGKGETVSAPAGGGAAGSPRGTGGYGGRECCAGGGGIGGSPGLNFKCYTVACTPNFNFQCNVIVQIANAGSALQARAFSANGDCRSTSVLIDRSIPSPTTPTIVTEIGSVGCSGFYNSVFNKAPCNPACPTTTPGESVGNFYTSTNSANRSWGNEWFYVEDMAGAATACWSTPISVLGTPCGPAGAGAGSYSNTAAGVLGGGGDCGGGCCFGSAGCAGGQGSGPTAGFTAPGTPGMVVIYW